jgi:hypothetical protein
MKNMKCESGWTGDRCSFRLDHFGPHSNEGGPVATFRVTVVYDWTSGMRVTRKERTFSSEEAFQRWLSKNEEHVTVLKTAKEF